VNTTSAHNVDVVFFEWLFARDDIDDRSPRGGAAAPPSLRLCRADTRGEWGPTGISTPALGKVNTRPAVIGSTSGFGGRNRHCFKNAGRAKKGESAGANQSNRSSSAALSLGH
jgi:hypothetical protein